MESNNSASDNQLEKSFVFVLTPIDVHGQLPIEVAPGHFFQRADIEQIKKIKKLLDLFIPYPQRIIFKPPYEVNVIKVPGDKKGSYSYKSEPLPLNEYRYWIISFEGTNTELEYIASATSIIQKDLELGFTIFGKSSITGEGFGWHGPSLFSFFDSPKSKEPAVLMTDDELREISVNYDLIKQIDPEYEHITRAFNKFRDLKSLPRNSELVIIGLFSIVESLITHCPSRKNIDDSLTHQIKTKIPLLSKRFQRELEYVKYFGKEKKENVWKKLYGYRSQIVHGEHSSLTGSLKVLKDRETVQEFLRETTKLLLLLSLQEPTLVTDLKKC